MKKEAKVRKVPKGTSSYQAAWIVDDDEDSDESESNDDVSEVCSFVVKNRKTRKRVLEVAWIDL